MQIYNKRQFLAEHIFYLGTILYMAYYFLYISFYWYIEKDPLQQLPIQRLFYAGMICFLVKIILTKYQWKEVIVGIAGAVVMYVCWKSSGGIDYPANYLILFAMKDVNLKKTMKAAFCSAFMALCYGFTWFLVNAPDKLTTVKDYGRGIVETRFKFCTWHANTIHLMILILILCFLYAYYKKCKWWVFLALFHFNYEFFVLTKSRTSFYCGAAAIIAFAVLRYFRDIFKSWIMMLLFQIGNAAGIFLSIYYGLYADVTSPNFMRLDAFITGRLSVARQCYLDSGIPLFGSNIGGKVCGYGIYMQANDGYVTELGIVRTLLEYGPIVFVILCAALFAAIWILHKKGYYGAMILLEVGFVACAVEAYFPAAYNLKAFVLGLAFYQFFQIFQKEKKKTRRELKDEAAV